MLAGLTGETFGNWLCIQFLFVSKQFRVKGIRSKLLEAAEKEAMRRGCKYAFVDTFSFQALAFYKKHGYREVFSLEEYPYRMNCGAKYEIMQKAVRGEQEKHWQVPWIIMHLTIGKELLSQQITRKSVVIVRFPKRTVFRM
jgi:hypothetical protein